MKSYDFPFNEKVRTFLRLEDLFSKAFFNVASQHETHHHNAMLILFQILDVVDRADLKSDLLQELERQKFVMSRLADNPAINKNMLDETLNDIAQSCQSLRNIPTKCGQSLRDNEWLMSIKQRAIIPGGLCEFDMPAYHFWLMQDHEKRATDIHTWLSSLMPVYNAIKIILRILRGSGQSISLLAQAGNYQQMLGGAKPAQMLTVEVDDNISCFPEVSANKYVINIRFNKLNIQEKAHACDHDIPFTLTLCNL